MLASSREREQQDARLVDESTRESDALHLAAAELPRHAFGLVDKIDTLEHLQNARTDCHSRRPLDGEPVRDV